MFRELLKSGVDLKIKDREQRNRVKAFFLEWDDEVKGWQRPYLKLIERSTANPLISGKSLTPATLMSEFLALRDWYDDPVSPSQAASELGVSTVELKYAASRSVKARLNLLAAGQSIPREAWERNAYRETALLLSAKRGGR